MRRTGKTTQVNIRIPDCHVSDFPKGTKLYIRKSYGGFYTDYYCSFELYDEGMVHGKVLESGYHPRRGIRCLNMKAGSIIKARPSKCHFYNNGAVWIKDGYADTSTYARIERFSKCKMRKKKKQLDAKIGDTVWNNKSMVNISGPRYKVIWIAPDTNKSSVEGKHRCILYDDQRGDYTIGTLENLVIAIPGPVNKSKVCFNAECKDWMLAYHVCGFTNPADIQDCQERITEIDN